MKRYVGLDVSMRERRSFTSLMRQAGGYGAADARANRRRSPWRFAAIRSTTASTF